MENKLGKLKSSPRILAARNLDFWMVDEDESFISDTSEEHLIDRPNALKKTHNSVKLIFHKKV